MATERSTSSVSLFEFEKCLWNLMINKTVSEKVFDWVKQWHSEQWNERLSEKKRQTRISWLLDLHLSVFCRSFVYAFLTRGRPVPLPIVLYAAIFCSLNGFLQGHHLLHCTQPDLIRHTGVRMVAGTSEQHPHRNPTAGLWPDISLTYFLKYNNTHEPQQPFPWRARMWEWTDSNCRIFDQSPMVSLS